MHWNMEVFCEEMDVNVDSDEPHRSSSPSQASAVDVAYSEDNRGRKRIRQPAKWKKNIRKRRRACGLEYISTSGKTVPKKHLKLFGCRFPLKCCTKLNAEQQQIVHDTFYDTSDWSVQTAFIASQTKVSSVAHRYTKSTHSRRNYSKHFYLPVAGVDVRVCKTFLRECSVFLMEDLPELLTKSNMECHTVTSVVGTHHITKPPESSWFCEGVYWTAPEAWVSLLPLP